MQVLLTESSVIDMREIADYLIGVAGANIARKVIDEIERIIFEVLAENPQLGIQAFDDSESILFFPAGKYAVYQIYYQIQDDALEIYRVLHGKRDIQSILSR